MPSLKNLAIGFASRCAGTKARRWPDDEEFISALTQNECYKRRGLKLMLARIEASFGHKEPASLNTISIEHVIPQTLSPDWKEGLDRAQIKALSGAGIFGAT